MKIDTSSEARLRIDKWLWCARFFKTRTLATEAVDKGHVLLAGQPCRPAKEIKPGDRLRIGVHQQQWEVVVLGVADARGAAAVAQTLYEETPESRLRREEEAERRKLYREPAAQIHGRPTKRDRRQMARIKP
jgi:ribosome-associated heat shock protein Hsp15